MYSMFNNFFSLFKFKILAHCGESRYMRGTHILVHIERRKLNKDHIFEIKDIRLDLHVSFLIK